MSGYVDPASNLSEAWLRTLEVVTAEGGFAVNLMTTVTDPTAAEDQGIRAAVDAVLVEGYRGKTRIQTVDTVAGTIFPVDLYADPGFAYHRDLTPERVAVLDQAAADLYEAYADMLPVLTTDTANSRGTYFGRMTTWPGKTGGGTNQLADRIKSLRRVRRLNNLRRNLEDIAVGGEGEGLIDGPELAGVQVYTADEHRERGFPCLVHIDLTVFDGRLSMAAVYRHQYLLTKAYGNLLGLSRLLVFLAKQSGYEVGELVVNATMADSESSTFTKAGVRDLISASRSALIT
jgi:hypothetical protein